MRIAILSDIHGNIAALDAVLADVEGRGVDAIVNLGDILSGPLFPCETADRLMALDLPTIRGNHERQLLTQHPDRMGASDRYTDAVLQSRHRDWIASLPDSLWLADDVLMVHGAPGDDLCYWLETLDPTGLRPATAEEVEARAGGVAAPLVLCGHTHVPRIHYRPGGGLIVNPGSVGLPAYADDHPFPHKVETGSPHARYAIAERTAAGWTAESIAIRYDWDAAARAAQAHGRADWAAALRTGRA
ncbi:metallophosphoesterase family protein [Sphingobium sp. AR-3-1]|uniref:Metallophosphoesterase family protein n=1 Tax=Sphingobium psychrophilum TaxID=2728834 RepID=A0A7X9WSN5_9SPHN|nr:metallophosphoesterase family protein [Sphingobium psychrophilum]NML09147.1 metallophosphoesterase family protein [Sphingobium psychrophilum]